MSQLPRFCGVFLHRGRLFICREQESRGPRIVVLPPKELDVFVEPSRVGQEVRAALADFTSLPVRLTAEDFRRREVALLDFFCESSAAVFERHKTDVTVRQDSETGFCLLPDREDEEVRLEAPTDEHLGEAISGLLRLSRHQRRPQ